MTKHLLKLNLKRCLLCISTHCIFNLIQWISIRNEEKTFEIESVFFCSGLLFKASWHVNANKKAWKWQKKSISTSFWVRAAPRIWLKYTTDVQNRRLRRGKKYSDLVKTNGKMSLRNIDINWTINWIVHRHWELCDCKQILKLQFLNFWRF